MSIRRPKAWLLCRRIVIAMNIARMFFVLPGQRSPIRGRLGFVSPLVSVPRDAVTLSGKKVDVYNVRIEELSQAPRYEESVKKLCCLNGVGVHTAMCTLVEVGDFHRFQKTAIFAAYLGLVPGEDSSSDRQRRTGITKAGNAQLRRLLIESAQCLSRGKIGQKSKKLKATQKEVDSQIVAYSDKANERLKRKFHRIALHSKHNIAKTAAARELACFMWGMMTGNYA